MKISSTLFRCIHRVFLFMKSTVRIYLPFICCISGIVGVVQAAFHFSFCDRAGCGPSSVIKTSTNLLPVKDRPQLACFVVETETPTATPETVLEQPRV